MKNHNLAPEKPQSSYWKTSQNYLMNEKVKNRRDADLDEVFSKLLQPIGDLHLIQALLAPEDIIPAQNVPIDG